MTRPKRALGQNFLVDPNVQRKIVGLLGATPGDEVLEIGPGTGALTRHLAGRVRRLVLVELDDDLAAALVTDYGGRDEVVVVNENVLEQSLDGILQDPAGALVIGNIPYNITTPIIFHLLEGEHRPRRIVLMIQREVADRIVASPGSRTYGALSVGVQAVARARREFIVGRNVFRPRPEVESAVVTLEPFDPPVLADPAAADAFRALTRACFARRRKQLRRILRDAYHLTAHDAEALLRGVGVDPRARPEELSATHFISLSEGLS